MIKKTIIAAGVALAMSTGAQANSYTLAAGQTFNVNILADGVTCFTFGDCAAAVAGSISYVVDNDADASANQNNTGPAVGSAIAGDGLAGFINITTVDDGANGVTFTVNSFNMDTYNGTSGGNFATMARDPSTMSGAVSSNGTISFDPTGRSGIAQFFSDPATSLGEQAWNQGSVFTSGNQINAVANLTGTALQVDGTAVIVSASNVANWGFFAGTPYTEVFSLDFSNGLVVEAVPVPAAVWLFGSGLLGLVGVARRKKAA